MLFFIVHINRKTTANARSVFSVVVVDGLVVVVVIVVFYCCCCWASTIHMAPAQGGLVGSLAHWCQKNEIIKAKMLCFKFFNVLTLKHNVYCVKKEVLNQKNIYVNCVWWLPWGKRWMNTIWRTTYAEHKLNEKST